MTTIGSSGTAALLNITTGSVFDITLTGSPCVLSFSLSVPGPACPTLLIIHQDSSPPRLITWPGSVKWPGATAPKLSATGGYADIFSLATVNNGVTWYGITLAQGYHP